MMNKYPKINFLLLIISIALMCLFYKNKGLDSLKDDWKMSILGALSAIGLFLFLTRKYFFTK